MTDRVQNMDRRFTDRTIRRCRYLVAVLAVGLALQACSPIGAYNAVAGRDTVAGPVVTDIAFGTHPRQKLDIYAPAKTGRPAPVVVFFYGGSWNSGNRQDYAFVGSALAARGFLTVIADYRLVPETRFPGFVEDGARAVRWVQDNVGAYGGDAARIALAGHSAGAYIAVMLAVDEHYLSAAGVPPSRIKAVAGLSGPYDFYPYDVPASIAAFGHEPNPQRTQPVNLVRNRVPPSFLATGTDDTTVKPRNTLALAARLRAGGNRVVVRSYDGIDHAGTLLALSRLLRNRAPVLDDLASFLNGAL